MNKRQFATPLLIRNTEAIPLDRIPLSEPFESESWLQELLFKHPGLLPVDEIDLGFDGLIPLARELRTSSGPLDLLYVNSKGYLTIVEAKLWRNPEQRRKVLAQIIDYAKAVSCWSYEELVAAVRKVSSAASADPLLDKVRVPGDEFDEARFIDAVTRNLRHGNFLLLIVGDGIHEGIEHMMEFLQRTPTLGFTLGLVEIAIFRNPKQPDELFVQPRVLARTREIIRGIFEFRGNVPDLHGSAPELGSV